MKKTKSEIEVFDDHSEDEAPNVIIVFPVFFLPREPRNKFIVPDVNYVRPYTTDFNFPVTDSSLLEAIKHTASKAHTLSQRGLMLTDKFFRMRDLDQEWPSAVLKAEGLPDIPIIFVEGPHYDSLMITAKKVSIN